MFNNCMITELIDQSNKIDKEVKKYNSMLRKFMFVIYNEKDIEIQFEKKHSSENLSIIKNKNETNEFEINSTDECLDLSLKTKIKPESTINNQENISIPKNDPLNQIQIRTETDIKNLNNSLIEQEKLNYDIDEIRSTNSSDSYSSNKRGRKKGSSTNTNSKICKFGGSVNHVTSEEYKKNREKNSNAVRKYRKIHPNAKMLTCPYCNGLYLEVGLKRHILSNPYCKLLNQKEKCDDIVN